MFVMSKSVSYRVVSECVRCPDKEYQCHQQHYREVDVDKVERCLLTLVPVGREECSEECALYIRTLAHTTETNILQSCR